MSENNAATESQEVRFDIRTIYIKDVSFESPKSPAIFTNPTFEPEIDVQMNVIHEALSEENGFYEVVLKLTVTAKDKEETAFLCEVEQAGVFMIQGVPEADLVKALEIGAPNILLPFGRQAICDLVVKGGFPQLLISPVNFEAVFDRRHAQAEAKTQAAS